LERGVSSVAHHILYELRSVTPDGLYGLEDVYFTVLDNLFDTRVRSAVNTAPAPAITEMVHMKIKM
jgi:hypothetical protein